MKEDNKCECEQHCGCVFTKEEIERLVDLTKQPSYRIPRGLTIEEMGEYMKDVGRRSSYGLTKEIAESISKTTEEAYKSKYLLTKEQVRKIGEHSLRKYAETNPSDFKAEDLFQRTFLKSVLQSLRKYAETNPSDFKAEDFIDLTNVQKESEVNNA